MRKIHRLEQVVHAPCSSICQGEYRRNTHDIVVLLPYNDWGDERSIADPYTQLSDWKAQGLAEGLLSDADLSVAFDMVC